MGLDYNYTCPIIDGNLNLIEIEIRRHIKGFAYALQPDVEIEKIKEHIDGWTNSLCGEIESQIKEVRRINSEMRNVANKQIDNLEVTIADREEEIKSLEMEVAELKSKIDDLIN